MAPVFPRAGQGQQKAREEREHQAQASIPPLAVAENPQEELLGLEDQAFQEEVTRGLPLLPRRTG